MSRVFKTDWLEKRCCNYFSKKLQDSSEHQEVTPFFEIAQYILDKMQDRFFLCLVADRLLSLGSTRQFLVECTENCVSLTQFNIDSVVFIARRDPNIIVDILIKNIEQRGFTEQVKYALTQFNPDPKFLGDDGSKVQQLYDLLGAEQSVDDFKLIYDSSIKTMRQAHIFSQVEKSRLIPNLCLDFTDADSMNFHDLLVYLEESTVVTNFYIFLDALYCWMFKRDSEDIPEWSDELYKSIFDIKISNGWSKISRSYIKHQFTGKPNKVLFRNFFKEISMCDTLASDSDRIFRSQSDIDGQSLLSGNNSIIFIESSEESEKVTAGLSPSKIEGTDLIKVIMKLRTYHEQLSANDLHLVADLKISETSDFVPVRAPITWIGGSFENAGGIEYRWGLIRHGLSITFSHTFRFALYQTRIE